MNDLNWNIDPILKATVYWGTDNIYETFRNKSLRGQEICQIIKMVNNKYTNRHLCRYNPDVTGFVDSDLFSHSLDIYENNQMYYTLKLSEKNNQETKTEILTEIKKMEEWFILIMEPIPSNKEDIKDYLEREKCKIVNQHSIYCDDIIIPFLRQLEPRIYLQVEKQYNKLMNLISSEK